jgi:hypothetical protein
MISQLHTSNVPVVLAMRVANENQYPPKISIIDLLKYLVRQALQIQRRSKTEKTMALSCARFQTAITEVEWFQLLESIMAEMSSEIYIVIDIEILDQDLLDDFSILSAFKLLFGKLSSRGLSVRVKVLFFSYGSSLPFCLSDDEYGKLVVQARTNITPASQRKRRRREAYIHPGFQPRIMSAMSAPQSTTISSSF